MTWFRLVVITLSLTELACGDSRSKALGGRLFNGEPALTARLAGDPTLLPSAASRCSNCHQNADPNTTSFGPVLTSTSLLNDLKRRGGPPSHYDLKSFCALLRTGLDPAHILIARTMPRYELDEDSCRALWKYVTSRS